MRKLGIFELSSKVDALVLDMELNIRYIKNFKESLVKS